MPYRGESPGETCILWQPGGPQFTTGEGITSPLDPEKPNEWNVCEVIAWGNVAIHLLEPASPDSFVAWGFFNSVFETKEYGESYILEKLAAKMLAADPKLQEEFDRRLLDPAFARSPRAR